MRIDMIWNEDGTFCFRARCARCAFDTGPLDDDEVTAAALRVHACA
jgi:hypothetical protein